MFCNNCGMEIQGEEIFCPNCGHKVSGDDPKIWEDAKTVVWDGVDNAAQEVNSEETRKEQPEATQQEEPKGEGETPEEALQKDILQNSAPQENTPQKRFCPNCGTENDAFDMFCKECAMPLQNSAYSMAVTNPGMSENSFAGGTASKKKKGLWIGIGIAAAVLVLIIVLAAAAMSGLFMGPRGKVLKAVAATMKDTPEIVNDLKVIPDILTGDQYTLGFTVEYDGDAVSGEFRNKVSDKQIYLNADVDGDAIDFLCGIHSGVLKASVADLDYVFMYDPNGKNDGYLCDQFRKSELKKFNSSLESVTTEKVTAKEIQKDIQAAFVQEFKELEFKEAKAKTFQVDKKDRECKGYKVKINEKNVARVLKNAGERISKRLDADVADDFEDLLDELVDEIKDDDLDMNVTFYLYRGKLAAEILEIDGMEICVEFRGGDYRMQNILITSEYNGRTYGEMEVTCHKKGSKETIEMEVDGYGDITLVYDTKSGAVSLEGDGRRMDFLMEGVYKHSGSEVSFALKEFEVDGDSLMDDEDIEFTVYAKKNVKIASYKDREFDLGSADEDDLRDLVEELEDDLEDYDYNKLFYRLYRNYRKNTPAAEAEWY